DGIRDKLVTGVQTCALPISMMIQGRSGSATLSVSGVSSLTGAVIVSARMQLNRQDSVLAPGPLNRLSFRVREPFRDDLARVGRKIGRASCRERRQIADG